MPAATVKAMPEVASIASLPKRLHFVHGLPPLCPEPCEFTMGPQPEAPPFLRIECTTHNVAYVLLDPFLVMPKYAPQISAGDCMAMALTPTDHPLVLAIANFNRQPNRPTLNLAGPLLINPSTGCAKQVVLENAAQYSARHPLV